MDYFIPGIDPLYAIGTNIGPNRIKTKEDARIEFASMFLAQMLKDVFKSQSAMFGGEGSLGIYSDNLYNDILLSKLSRQVATDRSLGFERVITGIK